MVIDLLLTACFVDVEERGERIVLGDQSIANLPGIALVAILSMNL